MCRMCVPCVIIMHFTTEFYIINNLWKQVVNLLIHETANSKVNKGEQGCCMLSWAYFAIMRIAFLCPTIRGFRWVLQDEPHRCNPLLKWG